MLRRRAETGLLVIGAARLPDFTISAVFFLSPTLRWTYFNERFLSVGTGRYGVTSPCLSQRRNEADLVGVAAKVVLQMAEIVQADRS